jgi:hypothetical protein
MESKTRGTFILIIKKKLEGKKYTSPFENIIKTLGIPWDWAPPS